MQICNQQQSTGKRRGNIPQLEVLFDWLTPLAIHLQVMASKHLISCEPEKKSTHELKFYEAWYYLLTRNENDLERIQGING